jgi:hypothetical protein
MSEDKARLQAFYLLDDIIQNKKYANLTLKNSLKEFESRDKAFICALVYGVLDKLINLDYIIALYAKGKINAKVKRNGEIIEKTIFPTLIQTRDARYFPPYLWAKA